MLYNLWGEVVITFLPFVSESFGSIEVINNQDIIAGANTSFPQRNK